MTDLKSQLESARLDNLALFRALDQMDLRSEEIPQILIQELFQLDADCAEALWALDQPPGSLDEKAMIEDTATSLERLSFTRNLFRKKLPQHTGQRLVALEASLRVTIKPIEAYNSVPGRDPEIG